MKHRKKWMVLAAIVLAAGVFACLYWRHTQTPEYKASQLVDELRSICEEPGTVTQWLIDLGLMKGKEHRDPLEIEEDFIILGEAAVPALIQALKDKDVDMRCYAAAILGEIGPLTKEVVPALIQALKDKNAKVRSSAALALGVIGPAAKESAPALVQVLKDENVIVREFAAYALDKIGPSAKAVIPALTEMLKDEDEDVRQAAAEALKRIEAKATKQENCLP